MAISICRKVYNVGFVFYGPKNVIKQLRKKYSQDLIIQIRDNSAQES